jgi:hypothetical protein
MLTENQLNEITYHSASKGETTQRVIIPLHVPTTNIKALDVSDLSSKDQQVMLAHVAGYKEYLDAIKAQTFNFETWVEHTTGTPIATKWRSFSIDRIV